ncbi:MAG: MraY family glycosyltransferase [Bacteroidota bacterium]
MESVLIFLLATAFSIILNNILLRFSTNFGVASRQSQNLVRWASTSKPTTGGISFYITFLLGSTLLFIIHPELALNSPDYLALFLAATGAFLIGFADDAYGTHPWLKLAGQIMCGVILVYFGVYIHFFSLMSPGLLYADYALTLLWVVGLMNSLNMLDNMDGVTGTVALSILVISMGLAIKGVGLNYFFYLYVAISGSFIGFLFYNWKPARIYMGDTGSMFIGLVVAYLGIRYFWNIDTSPDNVSYLRIGVIPLMAFIVPIMDTSFVTIARIRRGVSPMQGGRDHLTHHLVHIGVPEMFVPILLGFLSLLSGGLSILAYVLIPEWDPMYLISFGVYPIVMICTFSYLYRKGARIGRMKAVIAEREKLRKEFGQTENQEELELLEVAH